MSIFSKVNSGQILNENISEEITEMLESISNTESIINSYMVESSTIINESAIMDNIKAIIMKLIEFIMNLYEKFISLFMTQTDYINYILDKHSDKINSLTDHDLADIVYQYKEFNISKNIPIFGYFSNVQKYIDKLSTFKVSFDDIDAFRNIFSDELAIIRSKIIAKARPITEYNFIPQVRATFRGSNEIYMKHLTKRDLTHIIDGVQKYKTTKTMIEADRTNIIKEYNSYVNVIANLMNIRYNDDVTVGTLTNKNGEKKDVDIINANKHKTYQNLLVSFISQIAEAYSIVFKEKLLAIKDKYDMEMSILSQIMRLV